MRPFEALKRARDEVAFSRHFHPRNKDEKLEVLAELDDLIAAFRPYIGDATSTGLGLPPSALSRVPHPVKCGNCGHIFARFFLPADSDRVALMAKRGNFCPRCYATENITIAWGDEAQADLPMSFSANIVEVEHQGNINPSTKITLRAFGSAEQIRQATSAMSASPVVTVTTMPGVKKP